VAHQKQITGKGKVMKTFSTTFFNMLIVIAIFAITLTMSSNAFAQTPPEGGGGPGGGGGGYSEGLIAAKSVLDMNHSINACDETVIARLNLSVSSSQDVKLSYYRAQISGDVELSEVSIFFGNVKIKGDVDLRNNLNFDLSNIVLSAATSNELVLKGKVGIKSPVGCQFRLLTVFLSYIGMADANYYEVTGLPILHSIITVNPLPLASRKDWYTMLDSTFGWQNLNLPLSHIPMSVTPVLRRAAAFNLIGFGPNGESDFDNPILYSEVRISLTELFFSYIWQYSENEDPNYRWNALKAILHWNYGIYLDSLESAALGLPYISVLNEASRVSSSVLAQFSRIAKDTPVLSLEGTEWTSGDTTKVRLGISNNNTLSIAAYQVKMHVYQDDLFVGYYGDKEFRCDLSYMGYNNVTQYHTYDVRGMCTGSSSAKEFSPGGFDIRSYANGFVQVYLENGILSDNIGKVDYNAWCMKAVFTIYNRGDVNMNFRWTVSDAVYQNNLLLSGQKPLLRFLGDMNYDGLRDATDVLLNYLSSKWASGKTVSQNHGQYSVSSDEIDGTVMVQPLCQNGKTIFRVSFRGKMDGARRFSDELIMPDGVVIESIVFPGSGYMSDITKGNTVESRVYFTRYDSTMSSNESLVEITVSGAVQDFDILPLEGSFFSANEKVNVEILGVTGVADEEKIPVTFNLGQNYPNPFNPSTTINYSLPAASHVTLKIYNMLGQEVATLINEQQPAGVKSVKFDASILSSGIYFYRLTAGTFTDMKKMILMK